MASKIKKGDTVVVLTGKDKGKTGKVLQVLPKENKAIVEGVNLYKKHRKPTRSNSKGEVIQKAMPIHISNLAILDPKTKKPTRVRFEIQKGKKVRVAVKSGAVID